MHGFFLVSPEGMVLNSFEKQFPIYFMKTLKEGLSFYISQIPSSMHNLKISHYYYTFLIQNKTHIVNSTVRPTITSSLIMAFFFVQLMLFKLKLLTLSISKKKLIVPKAFFYSLCNVIVFFFCLQFSSRHHPSLYLLFPLFYLIMHLMAFFIDS